MKKREYKLKCSKCGIDYISQTHNKTLCYSCDKSNCKVCGKVFTPHIWSMGFYCSKSCERIGRVPPTLTCEWCKKEFTQKRGHHNKYCSKSCKGEASRVPTREKRSGYQYKKWVTSVYQRDNYTCQKCGAVGMIHAHHIKQWKDYPELRYEINNGITLCQDCHSIEHGRIIKRVSPRFKPVCSNCGKETKGRGATGLCQSCKNKKSIKQLIHLLFP